MGEKRTRIEKSYKIEDLTCQYCGRVFARIGDLKQHLKQCGLNPNKKERQKIKCPYCNKMCNGENSFKLHVQKCHLSPFNNPYVNKTNEECIELIKNFTSKKQIQNKGFSLLYEVLEYRNCVPNFIKDTNYKTKTTQELVSIVKDYSSAADACKNGFRGIIKELNKRKDCPTKYIQTYHLSDYTFMEENDVLNIAKEKFNGISKEEAKELDLKLYNYIHTRRNLFWKIFTKDDRFISKDKNDVYNTILSNYPNIILPNFEEEYHYLKSSTLTCIYNGEIFYKNAKQLYIGKSGFNGYNQGKKTTIKRLNDKLSLLETVDLENMSDHQLIELIGQDILPREFKILTKTEGGSKERKNDIKKLKDELSDSTKTDEEKEEKINKEVDELGQTEKTVETIDETNGESTEIDKYNLPELTTQELKTYDKYFVSYGEKNAYISKESINKIWNCVLSDNDYIDTLAELHKNCGEWLKYIINTFLEEYRIVNQEQVSEDYKFEYEPSLMQKLMSYRIATNPYYGNWCGTGAGKTNAFLIASRRIDARVTVCVCPNSVVDTIKKSIIKVYPNSNIVIVKSIDDIVSYNREQYNYIIFNYEKFSQTYSKEMVEKLVSLNTIDFICFDEVHRTKNNESSTNQNLTNLRILANEKNKDLKVLGMTATPLINNLFEVRNLLELITGTSFAEIIKDNKCTINNIHNAYKYLMLYGFRYVPDYNITCKEEKVKIISDSLAEQLVNFKNSDVNDIEGLFIHCKYNNIKQYITNRTIIYTQFIKKLIPNIKKELKNDGITFREYTGENSSDERDKIITDFGEHKFDVILASSPITTGVDGLQKYCDNIIILSLPWTNAEYTQLIGRVNRQGSNFKQVNIIIPQVFIELKDGKMWSWDEKRYNIIKTKRTLSDAVVDGRFASVFNLNRKKLLNDAIQSLKNGINDFSIARKKLEADYSIDVNSREYKESVICNIHQKASTSSSKHMNEFFKSNPDKWREYHSIRERNKKEWVEDPIAVIADKLNKNNHQIIADLGCGMNQLKTLVSSYSQWYSFDHYSDDDTVIKADVSDLKEYLQDNSVDAAVFCMSLWGTNYMDYIKEAYRYLNYGGIMYIAEPKDKINQAELIGGATQIGFEIISIDVERNGKTYIEFKKV